MIESIYINKYTSVTISKILSLLSISKQLLSQILYTFQYNKLIAYFSPSIQTSLFLNSLAKLKIRYITQLLSAINISLYRLIITIKARALYTAIYILVELYKLFSLKIPPNIINYQISKINLKQLDNIYLIITINQSLQLYFI